MRIAICDDSLEYIETIEKYFDELNISNIEHDVFLNGEDLIKAYEHGNGDYDALFLDMEMGEMDGIETANRIRKIDRHLVIVFVTSHSQYMLRSFECMPFRFLMKPLQIQNFKKILGEVQIKLNDFPETFIFLENKKRTRIYCSDIIFFESSSHWILIHTIDGKVHKTRKSMSELLNVIDRSTFARVHRAFVVNLSHIYQIAEAKILMHHYDKAIPLSKTHKKELSEAFMNYKERKYLL